MFISYIIVGYGDWFRVRGKVNLFIKCLLLIRVYNLDWIGIYYGDYEKLREGSFKNIIL